MWCKGGEVIRAPWPLGGSSYKSNTTTQGPGTDLWEEATQPRSLHCNFLVQSGDRTITVERLTKK